MSDTRMLEIEIKSLGGAIESLAAAIPGELIAPVDLDGVEEKLKQLVDQVHALTELSEQPEVESVEGPNADWRVSLAESADCAAKALAMLAGQAGAAVKVLDRIANALERNAAMTTLAAAKSEAAHKTKVEGNWVGQEAGMAGELSSIVRPMPVREGVPLCKECGVAKLPFHICELVKPRRKAKRK